MKKFNNSMITILKIKLKIQQQNRTSLTFMRQRVIEVKGFLIY